MFLTFSTADVHSYTCSHFLIGHLNMYVKIQAVDDDRNVFTSSMLAIMAEYGAWPHVTNASSLSSGIKVGTQVVFSF